MKKIVIIGGGAAGAKAASKSKRLNPENHVELYTRDDNIAISLCGLPYYIEGSVDDINKLIIRTPQDFLNMGIPVFLNHKLEEIYPEQNCVLINGNHIFYDELILALGADVNIPKIENISANNVFTLRSLESGVKIREKMLNSKSVILLGAGYIGIELAEAFIKNGLEVIIIEAKNRIASDFDEDFSKLIQDAIISKCNSKLQTFYNERAVKITVDSENNFKSIIMESNKEFFADFCVLATGASANVDIAKKAGIKLGVTGAIQVDNRMRTNIKNIFACGDCTQKYDIVTREPAYLGLGTIANKEGRVAAINATCSKDFEVFDGILSSVITRFFDYTISKTGLTLQDAFEYSKKVNLEPISATITKKDKASYMPSSNEVTLKIVADKRSGEILGAQSIGCVGNVAQRINTITSALKARLTVDELLHLDLAYAPPYSSSIDPILTAAYKLKEQIKK